MKNIDLNKIAEIRISYSSKIRASDRYQIKTSKDAHKILKAAWDPGKIGFLEEFKIILLNRSNRVLGIADISMGGISGTIVDVRIILQYALKSCACSIILSHNHPSGNTTASEADIRITKKIKEATALLDIQVLDHLIVTPEDSYLSMTDLGRI